MRTVPVGLDAALLQSKTADVRLTFRRRKLVFTSQVVYDSLGFTDPSDLDMSSFGTGVLRVKEYGGSLYTSYVNDLDHPDATTWTDRSIALRTGSRPGVHGARIWYQKANGDVCYRDYTSIGVEHVATSALSNRLAAFAPVDGGVYVYSLPDPSSLSFAGEIKAMFGSLVFLTASGEITSWSGTVYGDLTTPRYVDAVTLGGTDYVYVMDRAAGRVMEITRIGNAWSYGKYIIPIDAIDNITGVTLRYATIIKNQVFITCRVVNSSDNNVPVSMDAVIFGPAIYDAGILDSYDAQNYSFSRWSYLTSENIGGKLVVPGNGYAYYLGAAKSLTSIATILVGEDPASLKYVTSDFFSLQLAEQESNGATLNLQLAHDIDYVDMLDDVTFEYGYNGGYVVMGVYTVINTEEAGTFNSLQYNSISMTRTYSELVAFTPHQSYYIASQDKVTTNPATQMDIVVARGLWGKVTT